MTILRCPECGVPSNDVLKHIDKDHEKIEKAYTIPKRKKFDWKMIKEAIKTMVNELNKSDVVVDEAKLLELGFGKYAASHISELVAKNHSLNNAVPIVFNSAPVGAKANIKSKLEQLKNIMGESNYEELRKEIEDEDDKSVENFKVAEEKTMEELRMIEKQRTTIREQIEPSTKQQIPNEERDIVQKPVVVLQSKQQSLDDSQQQTLQFVGMGVKSEDFGLFMSDLSIMDNCKLFEVNYKVDTHLDIKIVVKKGHVGRIINKIENDPRVRDCGVMTMKE